MFPDQPNEPPFFTQTPRKIFAQMLRARMDAQQMVKMMCDGEALNRLVEGMEMASMISQAAPSQREGVRASLNLVADALRLLQDQGRGEIDVKRVMRATCRTTENQTGFNFPVANEEITFWSVTGQRMATYQMGPAGYNSSAFQASAVTYSGSNQIYVSNPGGTVAIGQIVSGQGIPAGTTVVGISGSSNSTITMSANATQSSYTSVPVTFTTPPPLVMTQTGTWYYFGGKLVKNKNGIVGTDRLGSIGKYYPYGQERPSATANGTEKFTGICAITKPG